MIYDTDTKQPDPHMEKEKPETEKEKSSAKYPRRGDHSGMSWRMKNENPSFLKPYQLPLPYSSRALENSLELDQKKFMEQVFYISINTLFLQSMDKLPKFVKYVMTKRK